MRRRDEPKLDELKKLLRRLEKIDVAPGIDGSGAKASSNAPPPGYVGALRGAAPPTSFDDVKDVRRNPEAAARTGGREFGSHTETRGRAFGLGAIIIGATTAAVVSSIVVIALVPWLGRQGKNAPQETNALGNVPQRPAFVAPSAFSEGRPASAPSQAAPASIHAPAAQPSLSPPAELGTPPPSLAPAPVQPAKLPPQSAAGATTLDDIEMLLRHADVLIRDGNLTEARLVLERASSLGSGPAALTLGATYDPARVGEFGKTSAKSDVGLARVWYERARALGTVEATSRLTELAKR